MFYDMTKIFYLSTIPVLSSGETNSSVAPVSKAIPSHVHIVRIPTVPRHIALKPKKNNKTWPPIHHPLKVNKIEQLDGKAPLKGALG